jgi:hypothetical protein
MKGEKISRGPETEKGQSVEAFRCEVIADKLCYRQRSDIYEMGIYAYSHFPYKLPLPQPITPLYFNDGAPCAKRVFNGFKNAGKNKNTITISINSKARRMDDDLRTRVCTKHSPAPV